jgi:hypothetical protein
MLFVEDPIVTVKCRTAIKELFLYFNLCLKCDHGSVRLMQYILCTICFADIMILLQILYFKYIFVMASQFVNISCLPSFRMRIMFIIEDPIVTVKCRTAIKELFLYFNLCLKCKVG